jgi:hypothetical protein
LCGAAIAYQQISHIERLDKAVVRTDLPEAHPFLALDRADRTITGASAEERVRLSTCSPSMSDKSRSKTKRFGGANAADFSP